MGCLGVGCTGFVGSGCSFRKECAYVGASPRVLQRAKAADHAAYTATDVK